MAEPTTSSIASSLLVSVSMVSLFAGLDPATVIGAFAGASIYVLSAIEYSLVKRLAFLAIAFVSGVIAAPFTAGMISRLAPTSTEVSHGLGALVASAVVIKLLTWLIQQADSPFNLLKRKE